MSNNGTSTSRRGVTCTERVRMNAIAGLLFLFAGDGIILYAVMRDASMSFGTILTMICGAIGVILGLYYLFTFMNRRVVVSDDGVTYVTWLGKRSSYGWDQVRVSYHIGRNAHFIFWFGSKKATFYGYDTNAQALYDYLVENERFDHDTMESIRRTKEKEEERIRLLQQKARQSEQEWDDED